jgi:uncharacterized protein YndB with AHSA1/START domain
MEKKTKIIAEPGKQELFIAREFDASRELVFKAYSDPKILIRWMGPKDLTMKIEKMECKTGGSYRYIFTAPNGNEDGFHGVVHEVLKPQRIIQTFEFEGLPESGHVVMETTRFEDISPNRTRVTTQSVFQSVADRDGMVQSGMERGVVDSHDRLDEIFIKGI